MSCSSLDQLHRLCSLYEGGCCCFTAQMFHDRSVSIRKMQKLLPPLPTVALNFSLWLARNPPEGLQVNRAAFIWWTGVHYKMRRWGPLSAAASHSMLASLGPMIC